MAPPEAGVTVIVTVLLASAVPTRIGFVLPVRLSVDDVPVSLAASCLRPMTGAVGAVWSSTNALVPVAETLPAASVATTCRPTLPSTNPPAGSAPEVGVAVAVLTDQLPAASAVVVYVTALPEAGVTVIVTALFASAVPTRIGLALDVTLSDDDVPVSLAAS